MGVIILFVENIIWAGKSIFHSVIHKFKTIFHVGLENDKAFTHIGITIKQEDDMLISTDQETYAESLKTIPLNKEQLLDPHQRLNESETSSLRSVMGQLNWLANISRPEISFQVPSI